jgi:hypothetical protein
MQFTTPSQDAGKQGSNSLGCRDDSALQGTRDTHSSALALETQQWLPCNYGRKEVASKWLKLETCGGHLRLGKGEGEGERLPGKNK